MTTDGYVEHIVQTKTSAGIMALIVLGAIITVVGAFFMFFVPGGSIFGLPLAVVGVIIFSLAINRKECEFEYLFVNDDVEVARITAKSSRKQVYHFEGGEVKQITTVDSIYRDNEHQANSCIKTMNFTSKDKNTENPVYSFILNKNNRTEEVLLELDAKTIEHVKQFFKGKIRE